MSDAPLFQNADEQEATYAPDQVPGNERVTADETSGIVRSSINREDTPVAVPLGVSGSGGGSAAATPVSDEFDTGMDRERHDLERGDTSVVGPDTRDERDT